ncbi:MAG: anti-sigma factor, partial [Gemmatimonadetes bacterium]|nr:anti-sigma factor [Gemmatimonadota bacterium]
LLAEHPHVDAEWVDRLIGELDAATLDDSDEALPVGLRRRLIESMPGASATNGPAEVGSAGAGRSQAIPAGQPAQGTAWIRRVPRWSGWLAAAVVAGIWLGTGSGPDAPAPLDFPSVASLSDAVVAQWAPGGDETGADVSGEVAWSASRQAGVMRLRGLAVNTPGEFQYQLWIFDRARDERYPVDGGVFDVPPGETEAEVAIRAKLHVDDATLFAVTVESPGGVVVSDRQRIATVAQVSD